MIKTYYKKRGNAYEPKDTIQPEWWINRDVVMCTYWDGCDIAIIRDVFRIAESSDPSVRRNQCDEYGIYYDAR